MNPPPQAFYTAYVKTDGGLRYLSMVQGVGPNQAKTRVLANWKDVAPNMVADIKSGKTVLIVRRTKIKKANREAPNIPSQPKKIGFFNVFGDKVKVRMEGGKKNGT